MIRVGIVGGTGYTGVELLRLLLAHKDVEISVITSRGEAGMPVSQLFPNLRGHCDLEFTEPSPDTLLGCDLVFFATPNGIAMQWAEQLLVNDVRIIDLAADFRLKDTALWEKWYGQQHACPSILDEAVYGLCEINREQVRNARIVANPGCYPTAVQLGFLPLLERGLIHTQGLIADCKSGVSGAGRGSSVANLLCEAGESMKAYGVNGHRHQPEIRQGLMSVSDGDVDITFVPHLTPMSRGIHATLYAELVGTELDLQALYTERYKDEVFVDVLPDGVFPETRSVRGANVCRLAVCRPQNGRRVVVLSVIDNLVKGAAGQAVQNMNIMFGLTETTGLDGIALLP